ncbi:hypothetical protein PG993_003685 [Apiospora rasikravindrae]|uniref:GATA-type domain-containing protein n=1 Tax=Apiospora rasikravindrae TaxID=990691 RepID=A0ABR1U084_9PEZI
MDGNSKRHTSPQPNQYAPTPPPPCRHPRFQFELEGLQQAAPQDLPGRSLDTDPKQKQQQIELHAAALECLGCGAILLLKRSANKPSPLAGGGDDATQEKSPVADCLDVGTGKQQQTEHAEPLSSRSPVKDPTGTSGTPRQQVVVISAVTTTAAAAAVTAADSRTTSEASPRHDSVTTPAVLTQATKKEAAPAIIESEPVAANDNSAVGKAPEKKKEPSITADDNDNSDVAEEKVCKGCRRSQPLSQFLSKAPGHAGHITKNCLTCRGWPDHEKRAREAECEGLAVCTQCRMAKDPAEYRALPGANVSRQTKICKACRLALNHSKRRLRQRRRQQRSLSSPAERGKGTAKKKWKFVDTDDDEEVTVNEEETPDSPRKKKKKRNPPSPPRTNPGKTKKFKFAGTDVDDEEPLFDGAARAGAASTTMTSPPAANPDPGVVAVLSTDKGKGEASKSASSSSSAAASSATEKAREPVHIILHLRGGGGQLSHSQPIEPPRQHPLNTDTTNTTTSSPSSAAAAAEADSEEAWWKIPYNTSMPIPKSFFLASREYLLGHQTVAQLAQTHGVPPSLFQPALEHGVVVFVGLAIPGLQPVLRNEGGVRAVAQGAYAAGFCQPR